MILGDLSVVRCQRESAKQRSRKLLHCNDVDFMKFACAVNTMLRSSVGGCSGMHHESLLVVLVQKCLLSGGVLELNAVELCEHFTTFKRGSIELGVEF